MKPFDPLHTVLPFHVIDFLKRNPANSMSYYDGIDRRTNEPCIQFFIKCDEDTAEYVIKSPAIQANLSIFERNNDPIVGHAVFAKIEYMETQFNIADGFSYAIVEGDLPAKFIAESEFPVGNSGVMKNLKYLVKQPSWTFVYVSNDCSKFYNAKIFSNPLSEVEKKDWLYRIRDWMRK